MKVVVVVLDVLEVVVVVMEVLEVGGDRSVINTINSNLINIEH